MKEMQKDLLKIKIFDTNAEMGSFAAKEVADYIIELLKTKDEVNVIFASAPSQDSFLSAFQTHPIDWKRVNGFHMDEYIGIADDAPQGFGNFLKDRIFSKIQLKSMHYINTCDFTPEEVCKQYSALLEKNPIDVVLMGIGENGHIAFNDPGFAKFDDPEKVKVVELDEKCRNQQVNDGCFKQLSDVPTHAVTLTVPTLFSGKRLFCMVPRATKADAVRAVYYGEVTEDVPASVLRRHSNATLYCDKDSAKYLLNPNQ